MGIYEVDICMRKYISGFFGGGGGGGGNMQIGGGGLLCEAD